MTAAPARVRSWWGWGWADEAVPDDECVALGAAIPGLLARPQPVPALADLHLRASRVMPPASLAHLVTTAVPDRAGHTYGKAYRDVVRALHGQMDAAPDLVAYPSNEGDIVALLDWAAGANVAVVPYGGGSSVVGGVEYRGDAHAGVLSLDLTGMNRVLEIDHTSLAARIEAGALGPVLEDQLRPHGYTLRHFPQSFEHSTLGGWLATRSGGHYATLHTHIDDFVESLRVVTPVGISESWRLPGSGAGPSPDRLFLGSEGILGVISEAWMRLQRRPDHRRSASVTFSSFDDAMRAVRAIAQSGLHPANCRWLDPGEAAMAGAAAGGASVLVLGVESADHPVDDRLAQLVEIARDHGGTIAAGAAEQRATGGKARDAGRDDAGRDDAAETWRSAFLRMPYMRDAMVRMGAIAETFETATTWDRVDGLYHDVMRELSAAIEEVTGAPGMVNCRFTHVYPDGAAPYFTIIAAGRPGRQLAMWDELKAAAMDILSRHRASVTHHHAVGRDHRPGYDRQRPQHFAAVLRAAKTTLDPAGILNPGVLIDQ